MCRLKRLWDKLLAILAIVGLSVEWCIPNAGVTGDIAGDLRVWLFPLFGFAMASRLAM